ncbi:sugar transporter [Marinomonas hwangdonensis]|uniref:Sugar transporter n=1 Tax=Marinomonas hwangdonensis TaxID=1053647 RepID=A0A3M8PY68_9GAMM|nr:SLBB domain-containing protein [Marinomonas hwangdonensis]RNF48783.1 sugar transporter [Marinomonas hwangdonensis]
MRLDKRLIATFLMILTSHAMAFTPSAAQISQFQNLPKSQQEALARQYGVDLGSISAGAGAGSAAEAPAQVIAPATPAATKVAPAKVSNNGLPLFGYDVLSGESKGFTVVDDLPVPVDYQMGPGDVINVQMFGKNNQNISVKIDRDGTISLPELGPLAVSGQTFAQLQQQITRVIKQKTIGVDVSVTMGAMRTMQVFIVGEVGQPGAYNVNALTTITQALISSGGINTSGSLRDIQLKRKGQMVARFDLYDLLIKGDASKDVRLSAGDTLFIPLHHNRVSVSGQVTRAAVYEYQDTMTITELLDLAGGAQPQAYLSQVSLRRSNQNGVQQYTLDLSTKAGQQFQVEGGDEIRLNAVSSSLKNAIAVRGEVARQGALKFTPGMTIRDAIGSIDEGLKASADLNYALLVRQINQKQDIEVHQFSLLNALNTPTSADNLTLQEKDQIFVFDNGLEQGYWNAYSNASVSGRSGGAEKEREVIDPETGATVVRNEVTALNIDDADTVTSATEQRKTSREALLRPIVERLKEQARFGAPAQLIEVSGAVTFPGVYPLAVNSTLKTLLTAAGGLMENAYLDEAELSRRAFGQSASLADRINVSLHNLMAGHSNVTLQAMDHLIVKTQPGWQEGMVVELQGELVFPGRYTFQRGETLKDLIERAGGFTEFAYPEGAVLSRDRLKRQEAERLKQINNQLKQEISNMALRRQGSAAANDPAQAIAVINQLEDVQPIGRLVIDLNAAMENDPLANIMLEKGDKLFIPAVNPVVSIVGEVQFASHHTFNPRLTVDDYITAAGGTKRQADTGRVYVVKANGSVELPNNSFWFSRSSDPLAQGDTIIVPVDTDYLDGLSTLTTATQILYQIGVAWSAIKD